MISSSQLTPDATAAERRVAAALNDAACDGVGYFRFSLPRPDGVPIQEPDFVLVLRGGRIVVIEVKGCTADDIVSIDGDVWTMVPHWPASEERPRTQARGYALSLKEVLAGRGVARLDRLACGLAVPACRRLASPRLSRPGRCGPVRGRCRTAEPPDLLGRARRGYPGPAFLGGGTR
ncbi:nuclease-related domain-containing protein [Dankookia sp. P2]|uniref:nuclease-related domain-containing protein n=1 Tax=Dankookia sp. P2 TaxID=3423955 RepID=UPI003D66F378